MFGAVARSDHHAPGGAADRQACRHPRCGDSCSGIGVTIRRKPDQPRALAWSTCSSLQPAARQKAIISSGTAVARVEHDRAQGEPFAARHHQRRGVVRTHPAGQADMVGMEMRADHLGDARAGQGPRNTVFHASRASGRFMPASTSATPPSPCEPSSTQPAIDVLERPGNGQPHPVDAGRHRHDGRRSPARRRRTDRSGPYGWSGRSFRPRRTRHRGGKR